MRMTRLFYEALREDPADATIASHKLLTRGCFIRSLAAGIFSYLPLGYRVKRKIEAIFREEMEAIGGQQLEMPVVHPAEIWQESNRWYEIGPELARLKDHGGRDMVLGMTHEEVMADIVRHQIKSYRQLPSYLFQIQTKFRDELRSRGGLIRVREFTMKDLYSFHTDFEDLDEFYKDIYQAYFNIFHRCDLDTTAVLSDTGMMGGTMAHEFMYLTDIGEDTLIICSGCDYSANRQVATFRKREPAKEDPLPVEEIHTPGATKIEDLAKSFGIQAEKTAKVTFYMSGDEFFIAIVPGDYEVNETKLACLIKATDLRPATDSEILDKGIVPGFASPIGIEDVTVVVDELITTTPNLVAGANKDDYHLKNVNYGRDFTADFIGEIAAAKEGDLCIKCNSPLKAVRGVEVGNTFKLGTKYSEMMNAKYLDKDGKRHPIVMGSYGIGTGRLMACIVEAHHDGKGIIWPVSVAPYEVYLIVIDSEKADIYENAERLYGDLAEAGIETLFDDRDESPGVKFGDADLIGAPIRLMVSVRSMKNGGVEIKDRDSTELAILGFDEVIGEVKARMSRMHDRIREKVVAVPFEE